MYLIELLKTIFHKCEICESKIKPYSYSRTTIYRDKHIKCIKHRRYVCHECDYKRNMECDI